MTGRERRLITALKRLHAQCVARMHAAVVPGFHAAFVVPKLRTAVQTTVDMARRFADAAEPSVALFLEEGMDDGFLQHIRTLADQIEAKHREAEQHRADRTRTAKAFRSLIREARRTAWLLDAAVRRRCAALRARGLAKSTS